MGAGLGAEVDVDFEVEACLENRFRSDVGNGLETMLVPAIVLVQLPVPVLAA